MPGLSHWSKQSGSILFLKTQLTEHELSSLILELLVFIDKIEPLTPGSSKWLSWMDTEENCQAMHEKEKKKKMVEVTSSSPGNLGELWKWTGFHAVWDFSWVPKLWRSQTAFFQLSQSAAHEVMPLPKSQALRLGLVCINSITFRPRKCLCGPCSSL